MPETRRLPPRHANGAEDGLAKGIGRLFSQGRDKRRDGAAILIGALLAVFGKVLGFIICFVFGLVSFCREWGSETAAYIASFLPF
ncbi:MAG: hypothetical protein E5X67_14715 [Mesorhizobium sp.]|nr:MAG: hypothetical protein E5X67_14715 [Mesorhizobium sp.]